MISNWYFGAKNSKSKSVFNEEFTKHVSILAIFFNFLGKNAFEDIDFIEEPLDLIATSFATKTGILSQCAS